MIKDAVRCYNCATGNGVTSDVIGDVNLPPMCPTCKVKFVKYWSCKNCGGIRTKPQGKGWEKSRWTACVACWRKKHGIKRRKPRVEYVERPILCEG